MAEMTTKRVAGIAVIAGTLAGAVSGAIVAAVMTAEPTPADISFEGNQRLERRCCVPSRKKAWTKKDVPGGKPVLQCKRASYECNQD